MFNFCSTDESSRICGELKKHLQEIYSIERNYFRHHFVCFVEIISFPHRKTPRKVNIYSNTTEDDYKYMFLYFI